MAPKTGPSNRLTRPPAGGLDPKLQALYENLEILNGARGKGMDRAVLVRDLVNLDLATTRLGAGGVIIPTKPGTGGTGPGDGIVVEPPEIPKGVKASGGFSAILIEWDKPTYKGHAYTEVLRAGEDDFSKAARISTTAANLLSDQVGAGKTYYYWVRFVNLLDIKGPVQSTSGVRGQTQDDIGDILDKLHGQIDETFLTPTFNSRLIGMEDLGRANANEIVDIQGDILSINERTDILSAEADILAEAAMEAATGVDKEGITRRKATAEIKLTQKVLVTDVAAQAKQILEINAKVGDNTASLTETKNAVVKLDQDTKAAVESLTQRLDIQKSEIDGNTANITNNSQTLVLVGDKANSNEQSITSLTSLVQTLRSDVDGNTANITTNSQTIVKVQSDANTNKQNISAVSERLDQLTSTVGNNTARITTNEQTIVTVDGKAVGAKNAADAAQGTANTANGKADTNTQSISVMSQRMTTVESDLNNTKSTVTQNSQTIASINADGSSKYQAQWGVKASVGDIQAGIGLTVKKETGKPDVSQCTVVAGQFSVGHVKADGSGEIVYPFIVAANPSTGQPGVFIDTAFIKAAKIQDLVAGEVIADNIKASATLTAPYIKGGRIEIGSRFAVDENGNMTATNGNFTGHVVATSGTFTGEVRANSGYFKGRIESSDGYFSGTVYANKIQGDVVSGRLANVAEQTVNSRTWKTVLQKTCDASTGISRSFCFAGLDVIVDSSIGPIIPEPLDFEYRVVVNGNVVESIVVPVIMYTWDVGLGTDAHRYRAFATISSGGYIGTSAGNIQLQIRSSRDVIAVKVPKQNVLFSVVPYGTEIN